MNRLLAADGDQHVRALLRPVRPLMTERAGVVRDEAGPTAGLTAPDEIEARTGQVGVHIGIGGFQDLAYAYDLGSAALTARATLECAVERRETQGGHHRSDHSDVGPDLTVDLQARGGALDPSSGEWCGPRRPGCAANPSRPSPPTSPSRCGRPRPTPRSPSGVMRQVVMLAACRGQGEQRGRAETAAWSAP
ncbi:hypothetical protein [Streptomyces sp. NPDC088812]|uniref:hypothetical protein n=1 Tax=Streptomyces sp. NPDC088812 TaxID=3365905 RepID=UPI0037FBCCE5